MATVRIQGVPLNQSKHIWIALRDIYGIGRTRSYSICKAANVDSTKKVSALNDEEVHPSYDMGIWVKTPYFTAAIDEMFQAAWNK